MDIHIEGDDEFIDITNEEEGEIRSTTHASLSISFSLDLLATYYYSTLEDSQHVDTLEVPMQQGAKGYWQSGYTLARIESRKGYTPHESSNVQNS